MKKEVAELKSSSENFTGPFQAENEGEYGGKQAEKTTKQSEVKQENYLLKKLI